MYLMSYLFVYKEMYTSTLSVLSNERLEAALLHVPCIVNETLQTGVS